MGWLGDGSKSVRPGQDQAVNGVSPVRGTAVSRGLLLGGEPLEGLAGLLRLRAELERALEVLPRGWQAAEVAQELCALQVVLRVVGLEGDQPVVGPQGLLALASAPSPTASPTRTAKNMLCEEPTSAGKLRTWAARGISGGAQI